MLVRDSTGESDALTYHEWTESEMWLAPRRSMRPDGKARGGVIAALWRRRATPPAGMQRPPNAIIISDSVH